MIRVENGVQNAVDIGPVETCIGNQEAVVERTADQVNGDVWGYCFPFRVFLSDESKQLGRRQPLTGNEALAESGRECGVVLAGRSSATKGSRVSDSFISRATL
nr:hypothetical protein [Galactobacter caseinivorans]